MSNWGIGLLFSPGPGGRPDVLFVRDVEAHCGACGLERIERTWASTSFHALTLRRLASLLDEAPHAVGGACTQCSAALSASDAVRWVIYYGFPGSDGLLQGFGDRTGKRRWLLSPHTRIDVQLVPDWEGDTDASNLEVDALDDADLLRVFGRVLNPKEAARRALRAAPRFDAGMPLRVERLADGLALCLTPTGDLDEDAVRAELAHVDPDAEPGDTWELAPLLIDGEPVDGYPSAPAAWLQNVPAQVDAWGAARHGAAADGLRVAVETFTVAVNLVAETPARYVLDAPGDPDVAPMVFELADIANEAARTLSAPADIARLEVDRTLAGITGLLEFDADAPDDDA